MKTILVTGGAGYIGSHISLLLHQHGYKVIIVDKLLHGQQWHHPWASCIPADYADEKVLDEIFSQHVVDAVVHCASLIEVGESVKSPLMYYENNVAKTIHLLQQMVSHGVQKIVFSSSCAIYSPLSDFKETSYAISEDHPKFPINPYGKSKLMIEHLLHDTQKAYGLEYVILRYFNVAGALPEHGLGEQHVPESHLIPLLLRAAQQQKPFSIFGNDYPTKDGTCVRDFVHVVDIAHAHILALHHLENARPSDNFNLGTGHGYSIKQVIEMVEKITELPIKALIEDRREGDSAILIADPMRAKTILQWQPRFSDLEYMIRSAHAWEISIKTEQRIVLTSS